MKPCICVGDKTSGGGVVISGSPTNDINGKQMSRVGDKATCTKKNHPHTVTIVSSSDPTVITDGSPQAFHGDPLSCGCTVIASQFSTNSDPNGGGDASVASSAGAAAVSASNNNAATTNDQAQKFDEQLKFISPDGLPYANLDYKLTLGDGSIVSGRTNEQGMTERVPTDQPTAIQKADFFSNVLRCCEKHIDEADTSGPLQTVELSGVKTNAQNVGSSVVTITAKGKARSLTAGEIAMAKQIFKDAIDYSKVKVHKGAYIAGQDDRTAMTPNGEMYFKPNDFMEDFSVLQDSDKTWFMHEMTHVWQYQLGYSVKWHGLMIGMSGGYKDGKAYKYDWQTQSDTKMSDYNMEQQGDLVSHYFSVATLGNDDYKARLPFLSHVLTKFLENPKNAALLPK
jgi:uncharacterized Zn-binding protein involved in type VI secretion